MYVDYNMSLNEEKKRREKTIVKGTVRNLTGVCGV